MLKFSLVMRYEFVVHTLQQQQSVLIIFKLSIAKSINLKVLSVYSLKCTKLSGYRPYVVLQIFFVERECTAAH